MIARFDHAVIAVRDLEEAMRGFRNLGFDVHPGGRHTGLGTHNAIVRFGLDYLELLSVADAAEANAAGASGQALASFLQRQAGGLVGYALATANIEAIGERFQHAGFAAEGPFAMERVRPDGRLLSWRLLVPGGLPWRRPWPFLIQWDAPDAQRLSWEQPGVHPNGVTGVAGIAVAVHDLEGAIDLYERHLGLSPQHQDDAPALAARRVTFAVGAFRIDLLAPTGDGPVRRVLDTEGEGPFQLDLAVEDLTHARTVLAESGIAVEPAPDAPDTLHLPAERAFGARLALTTRVGS